MPERFGSPDFNNSEKSSQENIDKNRRRFLKILGATAAGLLIYGGKKALFDGEESIERKEGKVERLLGISEFKDIGDGALVICANPAEYHSVLDFLQKHNDKRARSAKFRDAQSEHGVYSVSIPVKKQSARGRPPGDFGPEGPDIIRVRVVEQNNASLSDLGDNYGIIQLRGHTSDMAGLIDKFQEHRKKRVILSMGGCESVQFMKDIHSPETAIMAQKMGEQGFTSQNSHTFIALLDRLKMANSWEDLYQMLSTNSRRLREESVVPGSADYYEYVSGEKRT